MPIGGPCEAHCQRARERRDDPGVTDKILKRLPQPYDLIAEWARYVPHRGLLEICGSNSLLHRSPRRDDDDAMDRSAQDRQRLSHSF